MKIKKGLLLTLALIVSMGATACGTEGVKKSQTAAKQEVIERKYEKLQVEDLSEDEIYNLYKLGKVWGFVKYYHPLAGKKNLDMDQELFYLTHEVLDSDEEDKVLVQWIDSLGEFKIQEEGTSSSKEVLIQPSIDWIEDENFISKELSDRLIKISNGKRSGGSKYVRSTFGAGNPDFKGEKNYEDMDFNDDNYRLLALYRYWNAAEYFFPYKYLIEEDWNQKLKEFIPLVVEGEDVRSYEKIMTHLTESVKDGHARFSKEGGVYELYREVLGNFHLPLFFSAVEGERIYIKFLPEELKETSGFKVGDEILAIDGEKIEDRVKRVEQLFPQENRKYVSPTLLYGLRLTDNNKGVIRVKRGEEELDVEYSIIDRFSVKRNEEAQKDLGGGIVYIDPSQLDDSGKEFDKIMDNLKDDNKGLIVDLRRYPNEFIVFKLGNRVVRGKKEFVIFAKPNYKKPGEYISSKVSIGSGGEPSYKGKVVVLIDRNSLSQPEYTSMALRMGENVTLIGNNSYGADGNISRIPMPGGYYSIFTGLGVYNPDGSETQRIGIIPDIYVKRTLEAIREGRDEVMEKAIEIINEK